MDYVNIPAVVVICYLFAEFLKILTSKSEGIKKLIPILVGIFGGLVTALVFYFYPAILNVNNYLGAIAIGIISGLASTGSHQIGKQLVKGEKNEPEFF